ncbi:exopolysaccharide production protein ExoZ [Aureimonas sp. SA4125]|uniref:acyltransferase family protein n=1 Tax=Aureimonas sp. SA4125 TaxID=2826993 RepID=UPI001CC6BDBE|nr:acyltransferase [Aureimonas sp. SA4125]BDA85563.1 exopolysaccharide production protein ExoZ [Aureimonas sp. SA4125]
MINSLQYLRGVAAMLVVAFHAAEYMSRVSNSPVGFPFTAGVAGVDVFFVISGFVITWSSARGTISPLGFIWKRILRIVPLYWILTLFVAAVALLRPDLLSSTVYDGGHLLASLLFWPIDHPVIEGTLPVLIPGWTLNYEMAFYLVFALSLFLPKKVQIPAVLAVLVIAVALREFIPYRIVTAFYTMPLILEFGAGVVIARLYAAGLNVPRPIAALAFVVGWTALLAMAGTGIWRSVASGIPAAMIVGGAVFFERGRPLPAFRLPMLLGDASYSIYLCHVLVLPVLAKLWNTLGLPATTAYETLFMVLAVGSSLAVGIVVHRLIERPLLQFFRRGSDRKPRATEPVISPSPESGSGSGSEPGTPLTVAASTR